MIGKTKSHINSRFCNTWTQIHNKVVKVSYCKSREWLVTSSPLLQLRQLPSHCSYKLCQVLCLYHFLHFQCHHSNSWILKYIWISYIIKHHGSSFYSNLFTWNKKKIRNCFTIKKNHMILWKNFFLTSIEHKF